MEVDVARFALFFLPRRLDERPLIVMVLNWGKNGMKTPYAAQPYDCLTFQLLTSCVAPSSLGKGWKAFYANLYLLQTAVFHDLSSQTAILVGVEKTEKRTVVDNCKIEMREGVQEPTQALGLTFSILFSKLRWKLFIPFYCIVFGQDNDVTVPFPELSATSHCRHQGTMQEHVKLLHGAFIAQLMQKLGYVFAMDTSRTELNLEEVTRLMKLGDGNGRGTFDTPVAVIVQDRRKGLW